jgi:hypothetical protein
MGEFAVKVLELITDELFRLEVSRTGWPAWTDGGEGSSILVCLVTVEMLLRRQRPYHSKSDNQNERGCKALDLGEAHTAASLAFLRDG